jgi:hypothetical protein
MTETKNKVADLMPKLPALEVDTNTNHSPHVVILGAGASVAALQNGDRHGSKLPLMSDLPKVIGLEHIMAMYGIKYAGENFESLYDKLVSSGKHLALIETIKVIIENYFTNMELPEEATIYDYLILSLRKRAPWAGPRQFNGIGCVVT